MLLIGSDALRKHGVNLDRKTFDQDFICEYDEYKKFVHDNNPDEAYPIDDKHMVCKFNDGRIYEFEIAWDGSSAKQILEIEKNNEYASLEMLFLLKNSHKYKKSVHFYKTYRDYHLMKNMGISIPKEWKPLVKLRHKETYANKEGIKLNVKKDDFFTNNVQYLVEHDDIHQAVKHLDKPAYQYYMVDDAEVMCSKDKFFSCSEEVRLYGCLEEQLVLSAERMLIPHNFKPDPTVAMKEAFKRAMHGIVNGWFRDYWYDNYPKIWKLYNPNFVDKVKQGIESGMIRPYHQQAA